MKARPILFSGPMIQALRDGRKTQTRRVVKPQPEWRAPGNATRGHVLHDSGNGPIATVGFGAACEQWRFGHCPYGQPGELLWVREMHAIVPRTAYALSDGVQQTLRPDDNHDAAIYREGWDRSPPSRWRPSIHMHRWASRLTLRLTGVRAERLQDTSDEDAVAEGIEGAEIYGGRYWRDYSLSDADAQCSPMLENPRDAFRTLWDSINAARDYGWETNPWVWALTFEAIHANVDEVTRDAA